MGYKSCHWKDQSVFAGKSVPHIWEFKINASFQDDLLTIFSNFPLGIAVNELIQISQYGLSGNFQKFDYGMDANMEKYGQERPPQYDLNRFTLPTFFFYGKRDSFLSAKVFNEVISSIFS
jgi:hypothetical protein